MLHPWTYLLRQLVRHGKVDAARRERRGSRRKGLAAAEFLEPRQLLAITIVDVPFGQSETSSVVFSGDETVVKRGLGTLVLDHANTHTGGFIVEEGTLVVRSAEALGLAAAASLEIQSDGAVRLESGFDAVRLARLSVDPAARLDVGLAGFAVAAGGYDRAAVRDLLAAGRGGGAWSGATGILSSTAGLGTARSVGFVSSSADELAVGWAANGDANLDGVVNIFDLTAMIAGGKMDAGGTDATWQEGDFNYDGRVDVHDIELAQESRRFLTGSYRTGSAATTQASGSVYYSYYQSYVTAGNYWRDVSMMGSVSVADGLAIIDTAGTKGPGLVSESQGYAMILAAQYGDKVTFDRLSATVQAGIKGASTGLFPWYWVPTTDAATDTTYVLGDSSSSAADADIDIALAYVYADRAAAVYSDWTSTPSGSSQTYATLAADYIQAIRQHDFAASASNLANRYILTDGSDQAASGDIYNWHPDYSDPRAYQLFKLYDTGATDFWDSVLSYTAASWKAVFDFGAADPRTESDATGPIDAAAHHVSLSNPTYGNLVFSDDYTQVQANRYGGVFDTDSSRMPIRISRFITAVENDDSDMLGIANSILTALGTSYVNAGEASLSNSISIGSPWSQVPGGWIQNYIAAGTLALAGDSGMTYADAAAVASSLSGKFGTNGTDGSISTDISSGGGFNDSLTLWGLTVSAAGETPLQKALDELRTDTTA